MPTIKAGAGMNELRHGTSREVVPGVRRGRVRRQDTRRHVSILNIPQAEILALASAAVAFSIAHLASDAVIGAAEGSKYCAV